MNESAIAIIGMALRAPGASTVGEFWRNLLDGVEAILPTAAPPAAGIVRVAATMPGFDQFDAAFFGISPAIASIMDPQHRVFLEVAWEALEDAGYDPGRPISRIGVYAGATANTYFAMNIAPNRSVMERFSAIDVNTANANDFLTTRVSYAAGLTGPSLAVQCACSTSLVAVCVACQALLDGQCDMALAGGVSVNVTHLDGYRRVDGGMLSADGHCRPFAAAASGTVFGSGAGAVVLKPLGDAVRDGDHVTAVIIGSAVNNDGRAKVGYVAPGIDGQAQVVAEALANAGVSPDSIGLVEAHGTGTPVGDPIEVRALAKAYGAATSRRRFCSIGSAKANVGHLDAAAGVTGLIKAALSVSTGVIPGTPCVEPINPEISFDETPFRVHADARPWDVPGVRRAGVSAFGVGGTNAHVILEEPPAHAPSEATDRVELLTLSARSDAAFRRAADRLASWLRQHPTVSLPDAAYTLQTGRRRFRLRRAIPCASVAEAIALLADAAAVDGRTDEPRVVEFQFDTPDFAAHYELARALVALGVAPAAVEGDGDPALHALLRCPAARQDAPADRLRVRFGRRGSVADATVVVDAADTPSSVDALRCIVGRLWELGAPIDWTRFHAPDQRRRISLPTYPFERQRYWIDAPTPVESATSAVAVRPRQVSPRPPLAVPYVPPKSPLERSVHDVWADVLGIADIGIDDNFFDLGGDSLMAVRVGEELTRALRVTVPAAAMYEGTTIRLLAALIEEETAHAERAVAETPLAPRATYQPRRRLRRETLAHTADDDLR